MKRFATDFFYQTILRSTMAKKKAGLAEGTWGDLIPISIKTKNYSYISSALFL